MTANIAKNILKDALRLTRKDVTPTLVEGLKALDRNARLSALRKLRGKVKIDLDLNSTRRSAWSRPRALDTSLLSRS